MWNLNLLFFKLCSPAELLCRNSSSLCSCSVGWAPPPPGYHGYTPSATVATLPQNPIQRGGCTVGFNLTGFCPFRTNRGQPWFLLLQLSSCGKLSKDEWLTLACVSGSLTGKSVKMKPLFLVVVLLVKPSTTLKVGGSIPWNWAAIQQFPEEDQWGGFTSQS